MQHDSFELQVVHLVLGGFKSRELLEAGGLDRARQMDDDELLFRNVIDVIHREGLALSLMSIVPATRAELAARMPRVIDEAPSFAEADRRKGPMTLELCARGLSEVVAVHRAAIERVLAEQTREAEPIEALLREAPVPSAESELDSVALMAEVASAAVAHLEAIAGIARDLEGKAAAGEIGPP